jgi:hypothetical protein
MTYHVVAMGKLPVLILAILSALLTSQADQARAPAGTAQQSPATRNTNLGRDANGNPIHLAVKTGHLSNYDESKVGHYSLPDPLILSDRKAVRDATMWNTQRRSEILRLYEKEIYGRIPPTAPKVKWAVAATSSEAQQGQALMKRVVGKVGDTADAPEIRLNLYTPSAAKAAVPVILLLNFRSNDPAQAESEKELANPPVAAEIIARGWGYATVGYQDIQPDRADALTAGVIGIASKGRERAPDDWGAISAWAWGVSRVLDYLETDKAVNAKQVAVFGHSRLGKTVLWASAQDQRITAVYSSCAGEMGSALARRDYGETIDDMAQNFPYQFAVNFQKWVGRWNDMPVDAHMLIALSAPRPVFITGGTQDQWADPKGEFLAEVAAGSVYRLLGKQGVGSDEFPPVDSSLISGDLGWYYHTGGHAATKEDWEVFLRFLDKYFAGVKPKATNISSRARSSP